VKNRYKQLFSDTAVYGFGGALSKFISFLILPVYTRIFDPQEFGVIGIFMIVAGIMATFMNFGLEAAFSNYFMEAKNEKLRPVVEIVSSIIGLRTLWSFGIVILTILLSPLIAQLFFSKQSSIPTIYIIIVAINTFWGSLISPLQQIFRLLYKPWKFISISLLQSLLMPVFILFFVLIFHMQVKGYFLGIMISSILTFFIAFWLARNNFSYKHIKKTLYAEFLSYGFPLLPMGLLEWVLVATDRVFVMKYCGLAVLGVYVVGLKIGILIGLIISACRQAWWPLALDVMYSKDGAVFFRRSSLIFLGLSSIGAILITLASPIIFRLLFPKIYYDAWHIVGIICWSSIFYGFYLISLMGVFKSKKTHLALYVTVVGTIVNVLLNFILTPLYAGIGAAISTAITMMVVNVIGMLVSNRFFYVKWPWFWYAVILIPSWLIIGLFIIYF
jgi:O-antigen/teichoic acid export membrane protein